MSAEIKQHWEQEASRAKQSAFGFEQTDPIRAQVLHAVADAYRACIADIERGRPLTPADPRYDIPWWHRAQRFA